MLNNINNIYTQGINNRNLNMVQIFLSFNKKKKHVISVYGLIAELNRCLLLNKQVFFYYYTRYITKILDLFKHIFVITSYYKLDLMKFQPLTKNFIRVIYVIFFNLSILYGYSRSSLTHISLISRPQRQISITYKSLLRLVENKNNKHYILNTSIGLILDEQALQHRQGGQLLCKVQ